MTSRRDLFTIPTYQVYAGKDVTYAVSTRSFEEKDCNVGYQSEDMSEEQLWNLERGKMIFHDCPWVGYWYVDINQM